MNCGSNIKVVSNDKQQKVSRKISTQTEQTKSSVNKYSNAKTNSNTSSPTKKIPVVQPTSSQDKVKTSAITKKSELFCQIILSQPKQQREFNDKIETDKVRLSEEISKLHCVMNQSGKMQMCELKN